MLDDLTRSARPDETLRWDELRERRVLAGTFALVRARKAQQPLCRRRLIAATRALIVSGALLGAGLLWGRAQAQPETSDGATQEERRVELPGQTSARLGTGAEIRLRDEQPERVRVLQLTGSVSYEVAARPGRRLVVDAADLRVAADGARFTVSLDEAWVSVRVESGRAELDDGLRSLDLTAGEEVRVRAYLPLRARLERTTPGPAAPVSAEPRERSVLALAATAAPDLLERAEEARRVGRKQEAAQLLTSWLAQHPGDARAGAVLFALGRLERGLGRFSVAAEAFQRCRQLERGALAEHALAEEAVTLKSAERAREYLELYPEGTYARRMRAQL